MFLRRLNLIHEFFHGCDCQGYHVDIVLVFELTAEVNQSPDDVEDCDGEVRISLGEVGHHHFQKILPGCELEDSGLIGLSDEVAEDEGHFPANFEVVFVVEHLLQFLSDEGGAYDSDCASFGGAEIGEDPAAVLAVDGLRADQEAEDAFEEGRFDQCFDVDLLVFPKHVSEDAECEVADFGV